MSKEIRYWVGAVVLLVVLAGGVVQQGLAQENATVTYENPLAYIGPDNNLYITDASGGIGTAVTNDATYDPAGYYIFYRTSSWSPDGQNLIFGESESNTLYTLKSGERVASMNVTADDVHTAWSPDGTQIAFFGFYDEPGVFTVGMDGGEPTLWGGTGLVFAIGEGPLAEPAIALHSREQGYNPFREHRYLAWLEAGIFYGSMSTKACYGSAIAQADGTLLCTDWYSLPPFVVSSDGRRIIGRSYDFERLMELTFTPNEGDPSEPPSELPIPADAVPMAWSTDGTTLFYSTTADTVLVESEWQSFDGYPEFTESTLMLWASKLDGSADIKIYETRGYGIGRVAVPPSDGLPLVVSIVTSDVPAAEAFNNGASPDEIEALRSHVEMVALQAGVENVEPLWTLLGGQPLYGEGSFTVVTPTE